MALIHNLSTCNEGPRPMVRSLLKLRRNPFLYSLRQASLRKRSTPAALGPGIEILENRLVPTLCRPSSG